MFSTILIAVVLGGLAGAAVHWLVRLRRAVRPTVRPPAPEPLPLDPGQLEAIRENARMVVQELGPASGMDLGYDSPSIEWLDGFVERQRARMEATTLIDVLGSFLGEAIVAEAGGAWGRTADGAVGVVLPTGSWCFPFTKVAKQWDQGRENGESILGFYNVAVDILAKGELSAGVTGRSASLTQRNRV